MNFGPRKLLISQFSPHRTDARILLLKKSVDDCSSCYESSPPYAFPPPPPPSSSSSSSSSSQKINMTLILIPMICVLGAALVGLCYFTIMKRHRSNLTSSRWRFLSFGDHNHGENFVDENHGPVLDHPIWYIRTVGLQQSEIDSIPIFKYKKVDGLIDGKTECSVCLTEFEEDENLRLLPKCSHAFHIACIDTWLRSHKNCPLCRAPIVTDTAPPAANTGQLPLESAMEDSETGNDHRHINDENGEVIRADELRNEGENIGQFRDEQGKISERNKRVRVLSDLGDVHRVRIGEDQLQPTVRRSFSMDMDSDSRFYAEVAKKIEPVKEEGSSSNSHEEAIQVEAMKKQNLGRDIVSIKMENKDPSSSSMNRSSSSSSRKSFSLGRSLQSVPIRMKRSFSSGGKSTSSHRNSRSQELDHTLSLGL